ncbi:BZ3500_MvSof-1268-A1-R1_Chr2-1g04202 [Microbotryum saponariae]|uniref:BZ3500_MvSof-1268-A1-R1_Chr2-1g04202 protein n=1 Tax=Microbotryum saponariae TaxID=289078 RepID=A0A2X0M1W7_9BASI|nr:BZ3500_MvSof-1268-A1-R1_Chr2-1g04202 [Microbotryum saponariae]SCZ91189.1 BZ3501_MvSof-1269-A2-R1_Chr2-1g03858 [Microbotryum saponariae]
MSGRDAAASPVDEPRTSLSQEKKPSAQSIPHSQRHDHPISSAFVPAPFAPPPFPPLDLFTNKNLTVSQALHDNPSWPPKRAARKLFPKPFFGKRFYRRFFIKHDLEHGRDWTQEELDEAAKRGDFPRRPSDLFLKMYADVLLCLTRDSLAGNVSPALIGSSGTIPLSIVSTIPDIMQHYYDCIVLAEKEVFLVTNYWQPSDSVKAIASALKELDARVSKRNGAKIVVKIMWDRGAIQQLWNNHVFVGPSTYVPLGVPSPSEVPNLSIQIINFHRPPLGTFHQKALVVDRKIALINSNNIQDRPNVEMMVHLEGPIVDSMYDCLLLSWHAKLDPPLPCLESPSPNSDPSRPWHYTFADENPYLEHIDIAKAAKAARKLLAQQVKHSDVLSSTAPPQWWQTDRPHEFESRTAAHQPLGGFAHLVNTLIERAREEAAKARGEVYVPAANRPPVPSVSEEGSGDEAAKESKLGDSMAGTSTSGTSNATNTIATPDGHTLVTSAAPVDSAKQGGAARVAEMQSVEAVPPRSPGLTLPGSPGLAPPSSPGLSVQGDGTESPQGSLYNNGNDSSTPGTPIPGSVKSRLRALSKSLNAGAIKKIEAAFDDESLIDDFKPHMLHKAHAPFPIAMVNRRPHGAPGHQDIRVPQDAAWLAALRYAEKNVFIQTPTLNAAPLVRAVIEACSKGGKDKQGIPVTVYLGLGFNDKGESVPFQGGTNEEVTVRLYKALRRVKKEHNLHIYWYCGKDQIKPLNAIHKSRNCHVSPESARLLCFSADAHAIVFLLFQVKFMSVDGSVGICGNGNQDSQSFMHSQEANIMIDDATIVGDWMDQLETNQATRKYGKVDTDGIWRDATTGEQLEAPKSVSCFSAIWAMI